MVTTLGPSSIRQQPSDQLLSKAQIFAREVALRSRRLWDAAGARGRRAPTNRSSAAPSGGPAADQERRRIAQRFEERGGRRGGGHFPRRSASSLWGLHRRKV